MLLTLISYYSILTKNVYFVHNLDTFLCDNKNRKVVNTFNPTPLEDENPLLIVLKERTDLASRFFLFLFYDYMM